MTPKEIEAIFRQVLGDKTVLDILQTQTFQKHLGIQLRTQKELRTIAHKAIGTGKRLPAHVVDKFVDMTTEQFYDEVLLVLDKRSSRPHREREYISQLSKVAYDDAVREIVADASPEYREYLETEREKARCAKN